MVDRGHFVTYRNGMSQQHSGSINTSFNLRLLYSPEMERIKSKFGIGFQDRDSLFRLFFDIPDRLAKYCDAIYQDPVLHELVHSKERYDFLIVEDIFIEVLRFAFGTNFQRSISRSTIKLTKFRY